MQVDPGFQSSCLADTFNVPLSGTTEVTKKTQNHNPDFFCGPDMDVNWV
jgi:hypothetical protein